MNHHRILGLDKTASQDEVKQAYKKLALLHHPDRGGDPKDFAKITEAYNAIQKNDNVESIYFTETFYPNKNIRITQKITFAEKFTGKTVDIHYKTTAGTEKAITVNIPPGISNNQTITFDQLGDNNFAYTPPGKLYLTIKVQPEKDISRSNDDVHLSKKINIFDLIIGAKLDIELPNKENINLTIKQGTKPNTVFCIPGYGIPNISTGQRGNIYLKVTPNVPIITDSNLLAQLAEIRNKI